MRCFGTAEMPKWVRRMGAGMAKITVEISPGTTPRPNKIKVGIRYTNVGIVCIKSRMGRSTVKSHGLWAAAMPIGTPMTTETSVADTTRDSVSIVAAQ